eukprot:1897316-Pyramimonas_sp.AAC.1
MGREALYWVARTHANVAIGASGGAAYGARKSCSGRGGRMRTSPLKLAVGPRGAPHGAKARFNG